MAEIKAVEEAPEAPEGVPVHYFNGFNISFGNADFTLTFKLDNHETFAFKGSYTIMKTLLEKLAALFKKFEDIVGRPMLTSDEVLKAMKDAAAKETAKDKPK